MSREGIDSATLEEGEQVLLDFDKLQSIGAGPTPVIPAVAQDVKTGEVIIIGYVNKEALERSLADKVAVFWSTSRNELWIKGKTSGDFLDLIEVRVNCEQNSLLYRVTMRKAGSCHTKDENGNTRFGCFYRKIGNDGKLEFV